MRFSICLELFYPHLPFLDRLPHIQEQGFHFIEFWSPYDKDLTALHKRKSQYGLEITTFSAHRHSSPVLPQDQESFLQEIARNLESAKRLGCAQLIVLSDALGEDDGAKPAPISAEQKLLTLVKALEHAVRLAQQQQVTLLLEPLNLEDHPRYFLDKSALTFTVVQAVGSPYLKVLFDIYHMQRAEGHLLETITQHIADIGYFHVADVPGRYEPGTGELHYLNILQTIRRLGYTGTIGFECRPQKSEALAFARLKELIEKVMS